MPKVVEEIPVTVDGHTVVVERLDDGTFREPPYITGAVRKPKRVPYTGDAVLRMGGENTQPWMEEALKKGYHELPGDEPATDEAKTWDGWGTALKPSYEPIVVARKPR